MSCRSRSLLHHPLQHLLLLVLLTSLGRAVSCHAGEFEGQVVGVLSGDRISLRSANGVYREVKLYGIRIPSLDSTSIKTAHRHLHMLLAGRFVSVEFTTLSPSGVILGTVFHGGSDIALRMLNDGLAVTATQPRIDPSTASRYKQAEATARARGLGFWQRLR